MLACVVHGAGDLRTEEVARTEVRPGYVAVDMYLGGICGSDLHYWHHGAVGDSRLREPLVLGHEVVGRVAQLGDGVHRPKPGTAVAIHPAAVCGACLPCRTGRFNICVNVRYLGSAARFPHVQGGFRRQLVVPATQVVPLPAGLDLHRAVLAEPLAVALHAVHRAGDVRGREVLVTGAGPIGVLVAAIARTAGAARVVVTDLIPEALETARAAGATETVALGVDADPAPESVDVVIEASGAPPALRTALSVVRPGGTIVLLGILPPGDVAFAGNLAVTRELTIRGSFRFGSEFTEALTLLHNGLDVDSVVSSIHPLAQAAAAFTLASDRRQSCKVLLDLRG